MSTHYEMELLGKHASSTNLNYLPDHLRESVCTCPALTRTKLKPFDAEDGESIDMQRPLTWAWAAATALLAVMLDDSETGDQTNVREFMFGQGHGACEQGASGGSP